MAERRGVSFASWRGTVGVIHPTFRPGTLEEFIRLLPDGISVIPLYIGFQEGTRTEFREALPGIEAKVRELAEIGVDLIHPEGAPPFMVHGRARERELLDGWERRYGVPVITAGTTHVDAMRVLGMKRIVGVTYFPDELNRIFSSYFTDAGFDVLAMEGIPVKFSEVGRLSSHEIYAFTRAAFLRHPEADGVYMLGAGWRILDIAESLEQDLEVPVLQSIPARVWSVQRHLHVRQPVRGYGRLLAEMPPLPARGA